MKAVVMTAVGEPDVLQLVDVPEPTIQQETELLVRLKAAGVNPIDTKLRKRGTFYPNQMPAILGCDGTGIVEAVGSAVRRFKPGDEVYFCQGGLGGRPGTYAEWTVVDERFVARKPDAHSFVQAAASPLVVITAWEALYNRAKLQPGQTVLVHAGAGGVGHVAVQLAKLQGGVVCTTVSTQEKAEFVEIMGADEVILYKDTDFVEATLNWTRGQGVEITFDTVGGPVLGKSFAATQIYGDIVTLLEPDPSTDWKVARSRNQRVSFELMLTPMLNGMVEAQQKQARILERCADLFNQSRLEICISEVFPLAEAAAAHRMLEGGSVAAKLVLEIGD